MADACYLAVGINLLTGPFVNLIRKCEFVRKILVYKPTKWVNPEHIAARFLTDLAKNVKNGQGLRRTIGCINQYLMGNSAPFQRDSLAFAEAACKWHKQDIRAIASRARQFPISAILHPRFHQFTTLFKGMTSSVSPLGG